MTRLDAFNAQYGHVHGFMLPEDMGCFDFFLTWQNNIGLTGDYFEIGVLKGKSAFFSAQFIKAKEKIALIDINDLSEVSTALSEAGITVECHIGKSSALRYSDLYQGSAGRIRFFHIDGDHSGFATYADLNLAADAIGDKGMIALDDFFNRNYPQLMAAACRFLQERIDFKLLLVGANKAYIVRTEDYDYYYDIVTNAIFPTMNEYEPVTLRKSSYAHDMGALVLIPREGDKNIIGLDQDSAHVPY